MVRAFREFEEKRKGVGKTPVPHPQTESTSLGSLLQRNASSPFISDQEMESPWEKVFYPLERTRLEGGEKWGDVARTQHLLLRG